MFQTKKIIKNLIFDEIIDKNLKTVSNFQSRADISFKHPHQIILHVHGCIWIDTLYARIEKFPNFVLF